MQVLFLGRETASFSGEPFMIAKTSGFAYNYHMLSFLNLPAKILSFLEANVSPREMAAGVCLALFMGFVPLNGPMGVLLTVFFLVFKLNRVSTVLLLPVFKLFYLLGAWHLTDAIGGYLLIDADYLNYFWRIVTGLPVLAYLDLNNTLVAGGLAFSAVLSVPVYFVAKKVSAMVIAKYSEKIKDLPFMKWVRKVMKAYTIDSYAEKIKDKLS
jgi:uncharacterized protein (TIGR03546 family)